MRGEILEVGEGLEGKKINKGELMVADGRSRRRRRQRMREIRKE